MVKRFLAYISSVLILLYSCHSNQEEKNHNAAHSAVGSIKPQSIELNNKAARLRLHRSADSLVKANDLLDSAIKISPAYTIAYFNKIQILCLQQDYKTALKWTDSVNIIKPGVPETLVLKGLLLEKLNQAENAERYYLKVKNLYISKFNGEKSLFNLKNAVFGVFLSENKNAAIAYLEKYEGDFISSKKEYQELSHFKSLLHTFSKDKFLPSR